MTITSAMEGITAPRRAAPPLPAPPLRMTAAECANANADEWFKIEPLADPAETAARHDDARLTPSRRHDGWSAANQRLFLEAIAEGYGVENATCRVGLSAASAYAFRRTAKGAAFALGWRAANLVAREAIAETLLVRALEGQVDTFTRADGTTVTRHRHDNRLAMAMLARLDRQVEAAADVDTRAARLVAQEFDAFLGLVERDEGPARAGLFLARRGELAGDAGDLADTRDLAPVLALAAADRLVRTGVATAQEVDVADLDPAARADWNADQWRRAEAAGLLALAMPAPAVLPEAGSDTAPASQHSQHSPAGSQEDGRDSDEPVWFDAQTDMWWTSFPPPIGFDGEEEGAYGDDGYARELDPHELAIVREHRAREAERLGDADGPARDAWFEALEEGEGEMLEAA